MEKFNIDNIEFKLVTPMKNSDFQSYYANLGKSNLPSGIIRIHFVIKRSSTKADSFKNGRSIETWEKEGNKYITVCSEKIREQDRSTHISLMSNIANGLKNKFKKVITIIPPETSIGESGWKKEIQ